MVIKANKSNRDTTITRHRNYKSLFLFIVSILVVSLMVLSPLLTSCAPAVTNEKGALPEEEAAGCWKLVAEDTVQLDEIL